jgi:PleD family two-component response regulator
VGKPGHVLLVLEPGFERDRLEHALVGAGYGVSCATRPHDVLRIVSDRRGDLDAVVTGVDVDGLDGFALSRLLKADPRTLGIPIVFLTGGEDAAVRALLVEGADCVPRPANPAIVVLRVGKLVRARRAERAEWQRRQAGMSILAHELNDPLAAALTEVAFAAKRRGGEDERAEALVAAVASLQRVKGIVERMSRGEELSATS